MPALQRPFIRFLYWLSLIPLALAAAALAVANRQDVTLSLDPLPFAYQAPLYLIVLGALFVGLVTGIAGAWLAGHRWRKLARVRGRRLADAEAEVRRLKAQLATPSSPRNSAQNQALALSSAPPRADAA